MITYRPSRRLVISATVILTLVIAVIVGLPEAARHLAISRLESSLHVSVDLEDVDINLFTGRAAIKNLVLGADPRPMLRLPAAAVEFSRLALLTGQIDLKTISLENPRVIVERLGPATYNFLEAFHASQDSNQNRRGGFVFAIQRLAIEGGEVSFIDHTQEPDYQVTHSSLDLTAGPISSLPDTELTPTRFSAGVKIADGVVKVAGSTTLFGETLETQLKADLANVELAKFSVYLPYSGRLNLERALLAGQAQYALSSRQGKPVKHLLNGTLTIGRIMLLPAPDTAPIMQLGSVSAREIHVDLLQSQAQIGALVLDQPYVLLKRDSSGFNFSQFAPADDAESAGADPDGAARPMPLVIKQLIAEQGRIDFVDQTVSPVVEAAVQSLALTANDVAVLPEFATGQINAEGQWGSGSLTLAGDIENQALQGKFSLSGKRLPYAPLRGYVDQIFNSARSSGDYVNGELKIAFAPDNTGEIVTSISGNLQGHNMALQFSGANEPVLTTNRLGVDLKNIRVAENARFDIAQIALTGANLRVVRGKDGGLNLTRLWSAPEQEGSSPARQEKKETSVAIHSVTVNESAIAVLDRSVSPNYTTTVSKLRGTLSRFLPGTKRAELELEGILGDDAILRLGGWFTPFSEKPLAQLQGTIRSYALPPLNPYATAYISHRIRQGQITTEIDYTLKGDEIQATADIVLRDLGVGEKTGDEFAQRVGIPLELAVALLQDINGVIRLRLAMDSESGPRLNIGELIWRAVRNAIVRAITAPFRLVGNVLTLGGRIGALHIEPVTFRPGTRELEPAGQKQLDQLATLLKEKPKMELNLIGHVTQSELDALTKKKFWERIQSAEGKGYEEALIQVYRQLGGITRPTTPLAPIAEESLEKFVMDRLGFSDEELRRLATDRAKIVQRELQERGIDAQRLSASADEQPLKNNDPGVHIDIVA